MMLLKTIAPLLLLFPVTISAQSGANNCNFTELKNQQEDAATIQRLEIAWTEAYLRADTGFMSCLLAPDFTEIMRSGELKTLSGELAMAEKNRGKDLKMSELPKIQVLLHENVAVAYGNTILKNAGGKRETRWYSDSYVWKDGQWHAFFAQQTAAEVR
jgi:hypothetical protein